jgi:hypothetical protein
VLEMVAIVEYQGFGGRDKISRIRLRAFKLSSQPAALGSFLYFIFLNQFSTLLQYFFFSLATCVRLNIGKFNHQFF